MFCIKWESCYPPKLVCCNAMFLLTSPWLNFSFVVAKVVGKDWKVPKSGLKTWTCLESRGRRQTKMETSYRTCRFLVSKSVSRFEQTRNSFSFAPLFQFLSFVPSLFQDANERLYAEHIMLFLIRSAILRVHGVWQYLSFVWGEEVGKKELKIESVCREEGEGKEGESHLFASLFSSRKSHSFDVSFLVSMS